EEDIGTVDSLPPVSVCATDCEPADTLVTPRDFRPPLSHRPLTFSEPLPACGCACGMILQDPRRALPWIRLTGTLKPEAADASSFVAESTRWSAKHDLLESSIDNSDFVVE